MKRFLALLLAALMLALTFAGCGESPAPDGPDTPETPKEPELVITEKPNVKYPEFVTDLIAEDQRYQDAAATDNTVISCTNSRGVQEIITSPLPVEEFFKKVKAGEPATLEIRNFSDMDDGEIRVWKMTCTYDGKDFSNSVLQGVKGMSVDPYGTLSIEWEKGMPYTLEVFNLRDVFENYNDLVPVLDHYLRPFHFQLTSIDTSQTAEEILQGITCLGTLDDMLGRMMSAEGFDPAAKYPDGLMPQEDVIDWILRYFEADRETVITMLEPLLNDNGLLQYNRGEIPSSLDEMIPLDYQEDGSIGKITYTTRGCIDGTIDEAHSRTVKVKNLPDGSFRVISITVN